MTSFQVDFEPIGKRIDVGRQVSLLAAAQNAGIALKAVCGGVGVCQDCKIRCISGDLSEIQSVERDTFSDVELKNGWRLACQVYPKSDLKIDIPPESMTTTQRLQIEGKLNKILLEPEVTAQDFVLNPPSQEDLRADWDRFLEKFNLTNPNVPLEVLSQFSSSMREMNWSGRVIFGDNSRVVGFLAQGQDYFGLAVDIGTTKIAAFLVNLTTGETVGKSGAMNPQIAYGEDVVSRIAFANQSGSNRQVLQEELVYTINNMMSDMCKVVGARPNQVVDLVVVGNTAIHHLFTGLSVRQLGQAPYVPAVRASLKFPAKSIELACAPGAQVYMPPIIAGYVGADHIAMLLSSDITEKEGVAVALDIGTNTEISLFKNGHLVSCSCASGPAFEGAHIHAGMRAVPGAIESARFFDNAWHVSAVDDKIPIGICGSGILDVVSVLLESGQIDQAGRFTDQAASLITHNKGSAIVLVPAEKTGTGKEILVTRNDIREIQLAKAAIRAGLEALLQVTQTEAQQIKHFIVAGAFGTYLNLESAIKIGMFPQLPRERYHQIGNGAGAGALQMLISQPSRSEAESILEKTTYLELTTDPGFMDSYVDAMGFNKQSEELK